MQMKPAPAWSTATLGCGSQVLTPIMEHLATELWDQSFSQTNISASGAAIRDLPRHAAWEEGGNAEVIILTGPRA